MARVERVTPGLILLACLALLAGCASTTPFVVERTQQNYDAAAAEPNIARLASVQLYEAEKAVERLEAAARSDSEDAELDHLAYLADQRIAIARIEADRALVRERVKELSNRREMLRLEARTRQAESATLEAQRANQEAQLLRATAEQRARELEQAREEASQALARAKKLESELEGIEARRTAEGLQLTMRGVLFAFDSAELAPGARNSLTRIAEFLNEYPARGVSVRGHTDSVGSENYNQTLSERRARSVADFLIGQGVSGQRLKVAGRGESDPVAPNSNDEGRQRNRRVEILLSDPAS